jgi:serine protease Do
MMGIGEVGELLRRSTVHIRSSGRGRRQSAGSGVIWNRDGLVITNAHVVNGAGSHSIELWDGRVFEARVESQDERRDLASLRLPRAGGLAEVGLRESRLRPGELVVAVGNPMGFTGALTTGVVHAVGTVAGFGSKRTYVQAAIRLAPGNSGGPLADASGRLAGINTMVISGGLALAIPSADVAGFVTHGAGPRLGVTVQQVSTGLLVLRVDEGSAAERASLMIGDVLLTTLEELESATGLLKIRFLRGGSPREREAPVALAAERAA